MSWSNCYAASRRRHAATSIAALLACAFSGCVFDDNKSHCSENTQCGPGRECFKGFCVQSAANGGSGGNAGAKGNAGKSGSPATTNGGTTGTVSNPATGSGRGGSGGAGSGGRAAAGGAGSSAPVGGTGSDTTCQDGDLRPCALEGPSSGGMTQDCNRGLQVCMAGTFGVCMADSKPIPEACNGADDDCDGTVDEESDVPCYPDNTAGCTKVGKDFSCTGTCKAGVQTCANGQLSACASFTGPAKEDCSAPADENCDGNGDENCTCTGSATKPCYTGTAGTQNVGKCKGGTQACSNGMLGACSGQTVDTAESCANEGADDNCDGMMDNIRDRNAACAVPNGMGICALGTLQCVTGSTSPALTCVAAAMPGTETCNTILDDDCDGKIDEGFDLMTDEMHCGSCTKACAAGETCCGGSCRNTMTDANSCGTCDTKCSAPNGTCCGGMCKNTMADGNFCGGCMATNKCAAGNDCCDGKCVDLKTDETKCGANCGAAVACMAMQQCCASACVGLNDAMNCGACGKVCGGTLDIDGGVMPCMCSPTGSCSAANMMCATTPP